MELVIKDQQITFSRVELMLKKRDITNVFMMKNNKTLGQTFNHPKYQKLRTNYSNNYIEHLETALGEFLINLKTNGDSNFRQFLNKHGDKSFCEFSINNYLEDKGLYCYVIDGVIKYVGRCTDNFKKRINQGYGKIHPKNCFKDGQATNCHLNALINLHPQVEFGIYQMTDKTTEEIKQLEKQILASQRFEWNIQTR